MEFKDIITNNLENSGLLNLIRAELRCEIFDHVKRDGFGIEECKQIETKESGTVMIIKDFLEKSSADNTLKTFLSEVSGEYEDSLDAILKTLNIKKDLATPFIYEIIKKFTEKAKN